MNSLQPGSTRAWLAIDSEPDELENPWDEDAYSIDDHGEDLDDDEFDDSEGLPI